MKRIQVWVNSDGQNKKHEYDILQSEGEKRIIISDESDWIYETKDKVVGTIIESGKRLCDYNSRYLFKIRALCLY